MLASPRLARLSLFFFPSLFLFLPASFPYFVKHPFLVVAPYRCGPFNTVIKITSSSFINREGIKGSAEPGFLLAWGLSPGPRCLSNSIFSNLQEELVHVVD